MTLADLIRGKRSGEGFATATLATPATHTGDSRPSVATVATVNVATPEKPADAGATVATVATVAVATVGKHEATEAEVRELRRLIWGLFWDVGESEREAELAQCMGYIHEALAMYRRVRDEYRRAEELPGQRFGPQVPARQSGGMVEVWRGRGPLADASLWR